MAKHICNNNTNAWCYVRDTLRRKRLDIAAKNSSKASGHNTNNILKHRLQVPLLDNDPRPIREYLNEFLVEDLDQEEEPLSDRLGRMFKLH